MSKFKAGLGGNAGSIGAATVVVVVLALGVWIGNKRKAAEVVTTSALLQPETDASQAATDTPAEPQVVQADEGNTPPNTTTADVTPAIAAPAFDEVRREPDGMTVVAGRAAPGATVQLLRDGEVIATTTADRSGKFASLAMIPPDGQGHVLALTQKINGTDIPSLDEIILAPTKADTPEDPVVVAEAALAAPVEGGQTSEPVTTQPAATENGVTPEVVTPAEPDGAVPESITDAQAREPETVVPGTTAPAEPETPEIAVLKSTAEGVELLNTVAPEVMDSVALDTISYSDVGDVQLAGRAQPETQAVRVYLDNDAVINLPVDDQGRWRGDVPDVDEGIYTLRVDEVAADGSVTSRVETPFKRESASVLAEVSARQEGPIKAITVQTGATLWAIARDRYGDGRLYVRVFKANKSDIRDPDLIYPGQVFDLPD